MTTPKTCRTCAHRDGSGQLARCTRDGYFIVNVRSHNQLFPRLCDDNFSGWQPREGVLTRVRNWFKGVGK